MAGRGRGGWGRGRGRGGWGGRAKEEPYVLFPDDIVLPDIAKIKKEEVLIMKDSKLRNYWRSSPYYLKDSKSKQAKNQVAPDIERYSDRYKSKEQEKQLPLSYYMKLHRGYFPLELIHGSEKMQYDQRKVQWNPESAEKKKFDLLEKFEKNMDEDEKQGKKEGENDEDDEEEEELEEDDEELSDGDYAQNECFDDDEDDFNDEDGYDEIEDNTY